MGFQNLLQERQESSVWYLNPKMKRILISTYRSQIDQEICLLIKQRYCLSQETIWQSKQTHNHQAIQRNKHILLFHKSLQYLEIKISQYKFKEVGSDKIQALINIKLMDYKGRLLDLVKIILKDSKVCHHMELSK